MNIKCQENILSILKIKVQRSLIFKTIRFSRDLSESTTHIYVALLGVEKQCQFSETALQYNTVCTHGYS